MLMLVTIRTQFELLHYYLSQSSRPGSYRCQSLINPPYKSNRQIVFHKNSWDCSKAASLPNLGTSQERAEDLVSLRNQICRTAPTLEMFCPSVEKTWPSTSTLTNTILPQLLFGYEVKQQRLQSSYGKLKSR